MGKVARTALVQLGAGSAIIRSWPGLCIARTCCWTRCPPLVLKKRLVVCLGRNSGDAAIGFGSRSEMSVWAKIGEVHSKGWRRVARSSRRARMCALLTLALGLTASVWQANGDWLILATSLAVAGLSASAPGEP